MVNIRLKDTGSRSGTAPVWEVRFVNLFRNLLFVVLIIACSTSLWGQASSSDYEKIKIGDENSLFSGLDLSPDANTIVYTEKHSPGIKIIDWKSRTLTNEFHSGAWSGGSKISYSKGGKYLLRQRMNFVGLIENKVRRIDFEIVEAATGQQIKLFEKFQDVVISGDERSIVSLSEAEIVFWNLPDGTRGKSFKVSRAANAIDLSPDGHILAVSRSVSKEDLAGDSRYEKKKKAIKFAVNDKQMVSLYDAQSFARIKTTGELYDIIYNLKFSPDGSQVFVFQNPTLKAQTSKNAITYINLIDIHSKEPSRFGFTSQAISEPELKFSKDGKLFAINSKANRFQEIHLYDLVNGALLKRFELGYGLFGKSDGEKYVNDSHPSFTFLPGDQSILIAIGNRMILWNLELNQ